MMHHIKLSRHCLRLARQSTFNTATASLPATVHATAVFTQQHRSLSSLGGLPSEFQVDPRTQQLIDDIDTTVLSFGKGQDYSKEQDVEVTGNAMTLDSLIKLGK